MTKPRTQQEHKQAAKLVDRARMLRVISYERAMDELPGFLDHWSWKVRREALISISARGGAETFDIMRKYAMNHDPEDPTFKEEAWEVREIGIRGYAARKNADGVEDDLIKLALEDEYWGHRETSVRLLGERGGDKVIKALKHIVNNDPSENVGAAATDELIKLGETDWLGQQEEN